MYLQRILRISQKSNKKIVEAGAAALQLLFIWRIYEAV